MEKASNAGFFFVCSFKSKRVYVSPIRQQCLRSIGVPQWEQIIV